jgi:colanic acid biosynthesis glycosyl transferase WcaI
VNFAILTQYYPPEIGAPQGRLSQLASRFAARGHQVTVLTAMPNYPVGRIHEGYGGWLRRERIDGVDVVRTAIYPTRSASMMPRLANYFSFAASSALVGIRALRAPDYLLVESPPLFLGLTAMWLAWLKRTKMIFNVSDLWPESAVRLGAVRQGSWPHKVAAVIESSCYHHAWLVTGQSRSIVADVKARFPAVQTYHLSNGADTSVFTPARRDVSVHDTIAEDRGTVVLYAGLHGLAQGLDQLLASAERLTDEDVRFVLVGDGPEKSSLMADAARRGLANVTFLDPRPLREIPALLASADIIVVLLKTEILGAVPSKLYEAMASGRPLVLVASGEAADVVREHDAGIVVEPGDIKGITRAIQLLRSSPLEASGYAERARRAAEKSFDRSTICASFIEYLEASLLKPRVA